jgi:hypothetical protein
LDEQRSGLLSNGSDNSITVFSEDANDCKTFVTLKSRSIGFGRHFFLDSTSYLTRPVALFM